MSLVETTGKRLSAFSEMIGWKDPALLDFTERVFIEKVIVSRSKRQIVICFAVPDRLPSHVYQQVADGLATRLPIQASVKTRFRYPSEPEDIREWIDQYWNLCLERVFGSDPVSASALKQAERTVAGNQIILALMNQLSVDHMHKKGVSSAIERWFREEVGLSVQVRFQLDELAREKVESIRQKTMEEEQTLVEQMRQAIAEETKEKEEQAAPDAQVPQKLAIGKEIDDPLTEIRLIGDEMRKVAVKGRVFGLETRELASGRTLFQFNLTDNTDSIMCKIFAKEGKSLDALKLLTDNKWVHVRGSVQFDTFAKELVLIAQDLFEIDPPKRVDTAPEKRVELHLHTQMSSLDGVTPVKDLVSQAAKWGHSAVAITDHGVVQSFPEAYSAAKKAGIKCILGLEAYVVDDGVPIIYKLTDENNYRIDDNTPYVVFDTETTGLNAAENTLIEIAAVKMKGSEIIDQWTTLIDPETEISDKITELTGITNEMVKGQPKLAEALAKFREFVEDAVLVAHNAEFDLGFISVCASRVGMSEWTNPVLDTLPLARKLYPSEKNYRLKTLTQKFGVELVNHHRALDDTIATAKVFQHMLKDMRERGIERLSQLNENDGNIDYTKIRPFHATLLVKNKTGLKNLYKIVSESHVKYFYRHPRVPRSLLVKYREGLLVGTACQNGELFQAILRGKNQQELTEIADFYDYLEIQPLGHYKPLLKNESISSLESVKDYHNQIIEIGKQLDKPVVATGDVHFLNPEDEIYRDIFLQSVGDSQAGDQPPLYFMTTDEMLAAFSHMGEDTAKQIVVDNPQWIANQIEDVSPIPDKLYTPIIEGADDELRAMCYETAHRLYGDPLPEIVEKRLEKELTSIITHGFAVIYLISSRLVKKSLADGYLVGSRGSVGSSLVATFSDITEVNPLPPHYLCPSCKYSEFIADGSVGSGFDLPDKECPQCGSKLNKDGQDIPFETFLGFKGDKVPDIDLNFSGEYQPRAHKYTQELFGEDYVYRAGTIATVAEKTAFGYVKKYAEEKGKTLRSAEVARLVNGCTGIKRTTGQHPGGIIVVPDYMDIYDCCPIQYPADDSSSEWRTTHFDFHSIHDNLLKLDILGHDDPTVIRMLQDLTGLDPKKIPVDDPKVMSLFSGTEALGVTPEQIRSKTGTYGIPEFGTKFVRQMLEDTKPSTFAELVQISGLSHGTDVWLNNAQELIRKGICKLSDVIGCRDDIMVYLIYQGLDPGRAFKIMESVRKGKGVTPEDEEYMKSFGVPDWYIWSCKQIKYMFPKAHASAYVLMAVRIAWFKVHRPLEFYATYFTVRADDFDLELMCQGYQAIWKKIEEIEGKGINATPKEKALLTVLEMALEMTARGYKFYPLDLYKSDATRFLVMEDGLLPPFGALAGVGESAAKGIVAAREQGPLLSVEDLQQRSRASKTVIELLQGFGCLKDLPETNQLSLF
ncbi:PolC-type DNA polymerase III [Effusibacillus lacus]|uniref:DNA polymerase III PolC-type n=1 Tax=Effusibacillus lacus TaxID=1348429 RepID=A0A292YDT7_9BACL|nr:PolC-type DNA polymerase III [Effusibacillus lacus]TCS73159.1 DNA polymerase III catalytic subunit PolC type [Effusibacillus lacus]GAX90562.1 DNA polymerase III subunit alpha [Effusibacillus lacus]